MEISQGNSLCSYHYLKLSKMSGFTFYLLSFVFYKIRRQVLPVGGRRWHQREQGGGGEGGMKMNMVQIMCTHV
jgi:hypothetical protein